MDVPTRAVFLFLQIAVATLTLHMELKKPADNREFFLFFLLCTLMLGTVVDTIQEAVE